MRRIFRNLAACLVLVALPLTAHAGPRRGEQADARGDVRDGSVKPLREIERIVVPLMRGMEYLGPEYDPAARAYRLKFIRAGRVVFVDVDARSGQILNQSR